METKVITVAKDFSPYPMGRLRKHGEFSGEAFREDVLVPALKKYNNIVVNFDGVAGVPSSFLEEAFGGLIRLGHISFTEFEKRVHVKVSEKNLSIAKDRIRTYISRAKIVFETKHG